MARGIGKSLLWPEENLNRKRVATRRAAWRPPEVLVYG